MSEIEKTDVHEEPLEIDFGQEKKENTPKEDVEQKKVEEVKNEEIDDLMGIEDFDKVFGTEIPAPAEKEPEKGADEPEPKKEPEPEKEVVVPVEPAKPVAPAAPAQMSEDQRRAFNERFQEDLQNNPFETFGKMYTFFRGIERQNEDKERQQQGIRQENVRVGFLKKYPDAKDVWDDMNRIYKNMDVTQKASYDKLGNEDVGLEALYWKVKAEKTKKQEPPKAKLGSAPTGRSMGKPTGQDNFSDRELEYMRKTGISPEEWRKLKD